MDGQELRTMSSFEWASATQYIVYISSVAGLGEINSERVHSFPLARLGPDKLIKVKTGVLSALESNIRKLERFACSYRDDLGENELVILRTLYLQYKRSVGQVKYHLRIAKRYKAEASQSELIEREDDKNALPF